MVKRKIDKVTSEEFEPVDQKVTSLADLVSESDDDSQSDAQSDDDDNQSGDSDEEEEEENDEEKTGSSKLNKQSLSAQDVQVARETAEYFKSNIFKLQIDELLSTVKPSDKHVKKIEKVLHKLHALISSVPATQPLLLNEAEDLIASVSPKIAIPFSNPKPARDIKYFFQYLTPEKINVIGGFSLKTAIKQPDGNSIDLNLLMPPSILQDKDYLNYRYFHKRSFYLAYLACRLQELAKAQDLPFVFTYKYLNDDPLKPVLRVSSTAGKGDFHFASTKSAIYISVSALETTFDPKKLALDRNAIRVQLPKSSDPNLLPPTVLYNSAILSDLTVSPYLRFIHAAASDCAAFRDACKLARLWLHQRGFSSSASKGGFGHFEWSMLMAVLLKGGSPQGSKVLLSGYSSYQLFKATLEFLQANDLTNGRVEFSSTGAKYVLNSGNTGVPVIVDSEYKLNILYNMSAWSYKYLCHEAAVTCDLLSDLVRDRFESIFLKNITKPEIRYDTFFK
ncbi:hypothetical protein D0Z03_001654 [Geotrichum reessii]|nr:hypothetical protein D0Z03_001654 [Galactomyces reessii]